MKERFLPHSCRRYLVRDTGKIFDSNGEIIPELIDGHFSVKLTWVNGEQYYPIATLLLITFYGFKLDYFYLNKIEPIYNDDDIGNLNIGNLSYCFNSLVEWEEKSKYYVIPGFTNYAISEDGEIWNIETMKSKVWSITPPNPNKNSTGGYFYTRLLDDSGKSQTLFRHRALGIVFKHPRKAVRNLVINHINGIPGSDGLENLEWLTYRDNSLHAYEFGLRPNSSRPVLVKELTTGLEFSFPTTQAAAKYYGMERGDLIMQRLKNGIGLKLHADLRLFKYADDPRPWPDIERSKLIPVRTGGMTREPITAIDKNGSVMEFASANEAERKLGVKSKTIYYACKRKQGLGRNGFVFRFSKR